MKRDFSKFTRRDILGLAAASTAAVMAPRAFAAPLTVEQPDLHAAADPGTDDPCGKAVTVAKNVVTKLPKP